MADIAQQLNLYNFEDKEYAESRYVLTSPRSLMACDMLGVKVLLMFSLLNPDVIDPIKITLITLRLL